jgi:hypothetical protein
MVADTIKASSQVLTLGRYCHSTTRMASAGLGRAGGFRETSDGSSVDDRAFASLEHRLATVLSHLIYTSNGSGGRTGNSRTLRRLKVRPHKSRDLIISRLWAAWPIAWEFPSQANVAHPARLHCAVGLSEPAIAPKCPRARTESPTEPSPMPCGDRLSIISHSPGKLTWPSCATASDVVLPHARRLAGPVAANGHVAMATDRSWLWWPASHATIYRS